MREPTGFGIISYAHLHSPRYATAISAHPQARVIGIAGSNTNADVAQAEANRYGVPYFDNYEDMLPQCDLNAVYVATEPVRHREVVAWAAAHRLHVLCDKPLATTLEDADAIVALARDAGIKLMVPFNPRFEVARVVAYGPPDANTGKITFVREGPQLPLADR